MSEDRGEKALNASIDNLMGYFDSVQIFVTKDKNEGTVGQAIGNGNLFARVGQVRLWLSKVETALANEDESDINEDETRNPD